MNVEAGPHGGLIKFSGQIDAEELARLYLDPADRKILNEIEFGSSMADWLLALQIIFRRLEKQEARRQARQASQCVDPRKSSSD